MLSDVVMVGILEDVFNGGFRHLSIESNNALTEERKVSLIPLLYWSRSKNNVLTNKRRGTKVIVKGRIESDEVIGLYVLVECIQSVR